MRTKTRIDFPGPGVYNAIYSNKGGTRMRTVIPEGYKSPLSIYDTQKAISLLKRLFEDRLGALLNLMRVSAPLFVAEDSGLNDNLNGVEL